MAQVSPAVIQRARHLFLSSKARLTDQFGLTAQVVEPSAPLPEFLVLGSTNVGKSSLLTAILDPQSKRAPRKGAQPKKDVPRISKWAGFTATMSVYTVGNKLRLVDSPGYGYKSKVDQGEVVTKYIEARGSLIRQAYVLIHSKRGVGIQDREASALLAHMGIPFQFVMTKRDLGGSPENVLREYEDLCSQLHVPGGAPLIETSTDRNTGVDELRGQILQLSGLLEAHTQ